jgi:hypothetical protein
MCAAIPMFRVRSSGTFLATIPACLSPPGYQR